MSCMMKLALIGSMVAASGPAQAPVDPGFGDVVDDADGGNRIRARLMVMRIADASWGDAEKIGNAAAAIKDVVSTSIDEVSRALIVIVPEDHRLNEKQLVKYLALAGYTVTPGSDALLDEVAGRLAIGVVSVAAPAAQDAPHESKSGAAVNLTSLAESLGPLKDHFNSGRGRFRFVALLSPT